jgi:oligopeptide/dipeptide ABC transporter ATP-binding protein
MRAIRGQDISMVFQQPRLSLNPVFTVGSQVAAVCRVHAGVSRAEARARTLSMFKMVELPHPSEVFGRYPHELSGGMCQRVMIAMALICSPKLIIADEPTTALDVTVQADILELIGQLAKSTGAACLLITHDLGVVAEVCNRVVVLYCGQVVETGPVRVVFEQPHHPYTKALLGCCPRVDMRKPLVTIPGTIPDLTALPSECYYLSRCRESHEACKASAPELVEVGQEHSVRCIRYG